MHVKSAAAKILSYVNERIIKEKRIFGPLLTSGVFNRIRPPPRGEEGKDKREKSKRANIKEKRRKRKKERILFKKV